VQGDALGGGFEAALSSQVVIAEESAKFGLPEALFNLVPGMGACSFLLRRLHPHAAKRMILSGEIKTAREMLALGLVDVVAADGDGEREVERFIRRHEKHANAHHALNQIHRLIEPVSYDELMAVTEIWVDAALRLHERDLRMMEHLVGAQNRQLHHREPEAPAGRHQVPSVP
jgi:DSF synthase